MCVSAMVIVPDFMPSTIDFLMLTIHSLSAHLLGGSGISKQPDHSPSE